MKHIFNEIEKERKRQDAKWGPIPRNLTMYEWLTILMEEVGEAAEAILNNDIDNLYGELIQIAAVAVAILEEIEADRWKNL